MKTATKVLLTAFLTLSLISSAATLEIVDAGNPEDITIDNETLQTVHDIEVKAPNSTETHLYYSIGSLREAEIDLDSVSGPSAENVEADGANFSSSNFNSNSGNYVLELVFTDTRDTFRVENFTYGSLGTDGASEAAGLKFYAAADNETNSSLSGSNDAPDTSNVATSNYSVTTDSSGTKSGGNNSDSETDNKTGKAEISLEGGFLKPAKVEEGESVSNQLFNIQAHNLSLDGNTDTVTFLFPDELIRNNSLSDQVNQISSNVSISGSVRSADPDSDSVYEGVQVDLQEDGQDTTTANITLDLAMNYPESNTSFEIKAMIDDSRTGEDRISLGYITVSEETRPVEQDGEVRQKENQTSADSGYGGIDTATDPGTDTTSGDDNRSRTDREPSDTTQGQEPETPRAREYRPREKETLAIFGQIPQGSRAKVELSRDRKLEAIRIDPEGVPETFEIRVGSIEIDEVEGREVYAARSIETSHEVESANITFTVNRTWAESRENEVVMKRLHDGSWNPIRTTEADRTEESIVYRAETPGFSKFAITTSTTTESYSNDLIAEATQGQKGPIAIALLIGLMPVLAIYLYKKREG